MLFFIKHRDRHGEDGPVWLDKWLVDRGVCAHEMTGIEMRTLVTTLHVAGTYDQLNTPRLAAFEIIARRIAQIIEAYAADAKAPRWSNVHLYQGTTDPIAAITPGLRNSVARRRKDELELASLANKVLASRFGDTGDSLRAPPGDKLRWPPNADAVPKRKGKHGLQAPEVAPKK